jgi:hypothetical protein
MKLSSAVLALSAIGLLAVPAQAQGFKNIRANVASSQAPKTTTPTTNTGTTAKVSCGAVCAIVAEHVVNDILENGVRGAVEILAEKVVKPPKK